MINNNKQENTLFIENLTKTQLFILFVEEYYDLNS